jgi:hypothetical protein
MAGTPELTVERLAAPSWNDVYVDGGETIQGFLRSLPNGMVQNE